MTAGTIEQFSRLRNVAVAGLVAHIVAGGALALCGAVFGAQAMIAITPLAGFGALMWAALLVVYGQHRAEREEDVEAELLKRQRVGESIFAGEDVSLRTARKRLHALHRLFIPMMAIVLSVVAGTSAILLWRYLLVLPAGDYNWPPVRNPLPLAGVSGFFAFTLFLLSRYAAGLARTENGSMIRAGSSVMFLLSLACFALTIVLAMIDFRQPLPEQVMAHVIPWILVILSIEAALNFLADLYRPRGANPIRSRATFESRLLNILSEPGSVAGNVAGALNYQFGFEISKTWFYVLLKRSLVPLVAFQIVVLLVLSSIVVVPASSVGLLERFGRPLGIDNGSSGQARQAMLEPGLHFKMPWPIDVVRLVNVEEVRAISIGMTNQPVTPEQRAKVEAIQAILWTEEVHGLTPEENLLVATRGESRGDGQENVPVSIVRARIELMYRINDPIAYTYNYASPDEVLRAAGYAEVTRFLASTDIDAFLSADREWAAGQIRDRVRQRIATLPSLGVDVFFVGLLDVHPPKEVAPEFQEVVNAGQEAEAAINTARADAIVRLTKSVGSVESADLIARQVYAAQHAVDVDSRQRAERELEQMLADSGGEASQRIAEARAARTTLENQAAGDAESFTRQIAAYRESPALFTLDQLNRILSDALVDRNKFVIAVEDQSARIVDLQEPPNVGNLIRIGQANQ